MPRARNTSGMLRQWQLLRTLSARRPGASVGEMAVELRQQENHRPPAGRFPTSQLFVRDGLVARPRRADLQVGPHRRGGSQWPLSPPVVPGPQPSTAKPGRSAFALPPPSPATCEKVVGTPASYSPHRNTAACWRSSALAVLLEEITAGSAPPWRDMGRERNMREPTGFNGAAASKPRPH